MKRMYLFVVLIAVSALVLAACAAGPAQPSGGGAPAPSGGTAKPTVKPSSDDAQPTQAAAALQSTAPSGGAVELQNVTEGLASLNSYQSTFVMSFDGKDKDGQPVSSSRNFEEDYQKDPPAKLTKYSGLDANNIISDTANNTTEIIEVGGKTYFVSGTTCSSSDSTEAPTANPTFSPSDMMGGIKSSQLLGVDIINGVSAKHYHLDVPALVTLGAYANAKGEAWIADQGNFVVKYTFEATGQNALFGGSGGSEGTIKWDYEVTGVNRPVNITPPANCGSAADDIPTMADATGKIAVNGTSSYKSASTLQAVVDFYKKGMQANGWTSKDENTISTDAMASLTYTKDNRTVTILLTFDDSSKTTSVVITEQKQ